MAGPPERDQEEQERLNRQLMELLHRMTFQQREKPNIIHLGTGQMLLGLAALAVAINGAVLLVTDWLFAASTAAVTVAVLASAYFTLWFGLGLVRRTQK